MTELLLVALLGGVGAATRFVVDGAIRTRWSAAFPVATLAINVTGSALIGGLTGAHLFHGLADGAFTVAAVGFCGGYTTFSTAMVEAVRLVQGEEYRQAALYVLGSLALSLAAAALGVLALWLVP